MPTYGALHITPRIAPPFRKVLFVATGSGIAPFMPHIMSGKVDHKRRAPVLLFTTRKHGKLDAIKITKPFVDEFKPKCVSVISNQRLTEKVIYGLRSRGALTFEAILLDS
ncbi:uncharacterized protein ARMOST_11094 [Armillaria ostoyae]|uniref:Uncharacterized protein n=1 Tax=Armillaria ostoyae TaxID=47428 RepID=A0A284RG69_ARMOS|nr:uncharacterized protein ARMOST_11094 [Armillaria ostoyae]